MTMTSVDLPQDLIEAKKELRVSYAYLIRKGLGLIEGDNLRIQELEAKNTKLSNKLQEVIARLWKLEGEGEENVQVAKENL